MILNWIIHNPSSSGTAWIDIQPNDIDEMDYRTPIRKCIVRGAVEIDDLDGAARRPDEITLPEGYVLPTNLYQPDDGSDCPVDDGALADVVAIAVDRYVAAFTPSDAPTINPLTALLQSVTEDQIAEFIDAAAADETIAADLEITATHTTMLEQKRRIGKDPIGGGAQPVGGAERMG
jgi:hypothetical protein